MKLAKRTSSVRRVSRETRVSVRLSLDGKGRAVIRSGIGFLDHMLELFAHHGLFDLRIRSSGDTHVDNHHLNEDLGIVLGQAFRKALGNRRSIRRFGSAFVPMDESLSRVRVALDLSGRPSLYFTAPKSLDRYFARRDYTLHDAREFLKSFSLHAGANMHVDILKGDDPHHILESIFKAWARAMGDATRRDKRIQGCPSTKGRLD